MPALPRGEHALHPLLVALLLLILVVKPLVDLEILGSFGITFGLMMVILLGLFCLGHTPRRLRFGIIVAMGLGLGMQVLTLRTPGALGMAGAALALMALASAILRQTFARGPITSNRIQGAIAAYLLIGLIFAALYGALHGLAPGAFLQLGVPVEEAPHPAGAYLFFSFVTLTTTGYGDIVPVHPVARSLAVLEAITGQLYLAVLLARLVSLQGERRD